MNRLKLKLLTVVLLSLIFASCSHSITIQEAANGKAKCGKNHLR